MRRLILTDGAINEFPNKVVPEEFQLTFAARWMQGAVSIEWLLEHPEWYRTIDICSTAHTQAEAQAAKDHAPPSPA